MSEVAEKRVVVAKIGAPYGVKGWVKVHSYTDPVEAVLEYGTWQLKLKRGWQSLKLIEGRKHGNSLVAHLEGFSDCDEVRVLTNAEVAVFREEMPDLDEDEFYWFDLEGMSVKTTSGEDLGSVDHVIETAAHEVLCVKGERERLIPLVMDEIVQDIDEEAKLIIVDWEPDF